MLARLRLPGRGRGGSISCQGHADTELRSPSLGLLLTLGRRFMRNRSLAASTWLMAAVTATVVALYVVMSAFDLSGDQLVERDMGRYEFLSHLSNVQTLTPRNASKVREIEAAALAGGASKPMVTLTSPSVEPAQVDPPTTQYTEADWSRDPFSRRYSLLGGRWPVRPGEVVVTRTTEGSLASPGERLAVLAGHEEFAVVGVADDRFSDSHAILAAPGTFAGIGEAAMRSFPDVSAFATVFWEGGRRQQVTSALSASLARTLGRPQQEVAEVVRESTLDRAQVRSAGGRPWIDRIPSSYAAPSLLLPMLASLSIFGLGGRRLRRSGHLLVALGVRPGRAAVALGVAVTGWLLLALFGGVVVGGAIGLVARLVITRYHLWAQELSPFPSLIDPVARLGASALVACVFGAGSLRFVLIGGRRGRAPEANGSRNSEPVYRRHATDIRHGLATLAVCAGIVQVFRLDRPEEAMVLAGTVAIAVLLLVPELVDRALRVLPRTGPRLRLARQHLAHDRARATIAVVVLAAVLGLPLGYLTLLDTMIRTAESGLVPQVAPGQVLVSAPGGVYHPPPSAVFEMLSDRLGAAEPPVQLRYLWGQDAGVEIRGSDFGAVLALDTVDDAGRLLGRPLTPTGQAILADGGLLVWDGQEGNERVLINVPEARPREVRLPAATARVHQAWRSGKNGVVLTATAQRLGLPVKDGGFVFARVSDSDAGAARRAVLDSSLDPVQVSIHEKPELVVPQALFAAAAGMLLVVLLCSVAVSRAQVRMLRRYLGTLVAIGLRPAWARQVVLIQSAFFVVVSTVVALVLAIPPVIITAWMMPDFVLSIPWRVIGVVVVAFYVAALLAAMLSCRRIRASDRASL